MYVLIKKMGHAPLKTLNLIFAFFFFFNVFLCKEIMGEDINLPSSINDDVYTLFDQQNNQYFNSLKKDMVVVSRSNILTTDDDILNQTPSHKVLNSIAKKKLIMASIICTIFMIVEIIAGLIANSLALITDASHLLSDLSSFLISLFALWVSELPGTHRLSFGYHRAEILGALLSVMLIWVLSIVLLMKASERLMDPKPVNGLIMFITAFFGTLANLVMTSILGVHHHDHHHHDDDTMQQTNCHTTTKNEYNNNNEQLSSSFDNNIHAKSLNNETCHFPNLITKAAEINIDPKIHEAEENNMTIIQNMNLQVAYIHALGDLVQNIGVLIAAAIILYCPSWSIADPICTFLFSILVLLTTVSILREAINVLMEGAPKEIDVVGLKEDLEKINSVIEVHDLHVWSLSVGKPSLACHMVIDSEAEARHVLRIGTRICQHHYGILHTTIQIDFSVNKPVCGTDAHAQCH